MENAEQFWARVAQGEGCWLWTGPSRGAGYGGVSWRGSDAYAHRIAYELSHGPIPKGLVVCHQCDNKPCVRPDHLFLGTQLDNMRDMIAKGRAVLPGPALANKLKTHCPKGHEYTPENTMVRRAGSAQPRNRICKACRREYKRRHAARRLLGLGLAR